MELHRTLWLLIFDFSTHDFHGNNGIFPKEHLTSFKMAISKSRGMPWIWWHLSWRFQSSMEFHLIFRGIPRNSAAIIGNGPLLFPWNSMESGNICDLRYISWKPGIILNCVLLVPCNSVEFGDIWFGGTKVPWTLIERCVILNGALLVSWTYRVV